MFRDLEAALSMARETEARLTLAQARIVLLPSRIRLLRALAQKRSTVTELSKRTGIAKSTVLKHLRVLKKHDLIVRHDDDRLWIYYDLTRAGRAVGRLDPLRIFVLFAGLAAAGLLAGAIATWRWAFESHGSDPWGIPPIGGQPVEPGTLKGAIGLAVAGGLILVAAVATWLMSRRRLRDAGEAADDPATDTSSYP